MERNPNLTRERADFVFSKIQKYFDQQAYELTLSEIEAHRELLGSCLNIGNQLKLNKIISRSVVQLMLDAFEVDGDLSRFSSLFTENRTMLELHTDRSVFDLLSKYLRERDGNLNFKSRTEPHNRIITPDDSVFPDDDAFQILIKSAEKDSSSLDIERDFLDSIEKPSFHFAPLCDDEEIASEPIRSAVNTKAIHEDFFEAIRPPSLSGSQSATAGEIFEQLSFDSDLKETAKRDTPVDSIEPIEIEKTILGKNHSALDPIRKKLDELDAKTAAGSEDRTKKTTKQRKKPYVKESREIVENGQLRKETIHKSGGKITEITLSAAQSEDDPIDTQTPARPDRTAESRAEVRKEKKKAPSAPVKKIVPQERASSQRSTSQRPTDAPKRKSAPVHESEPPRNLILIVPAIVLAIALIFGGYRLITALTGGDSNTNTTITTGGADTTTTTNGTDSTDSTDGADTTDSTDASGSDSTNTANTNGTDSSGTTDGSTSEYLLPTDTVQLTAADIEGMTRADLRYALNEMFARHGWNFGGSGAMYEYFSAKSWYQPDMSMTSAAQAESKFNSFEKANLAFLVAQINAMS